LDFFFTLGNQIIALLPLFVKALCIETTKDLSATKQAKFSNSRVVRGERSGRRRREEEGRRKGEGEGEEGRRRGRGGQGKKWRLERMRAGPRKEREEKKTNSHLS
jgi:hypothetical protein